MPAPAAPSTLDGMPLSAGQQARFQRILTLLWQEAPTRDPEAIAAQGERAFRLTVGKRAGAWFDKTSIRLGGGAGPVLRLKT